MNFLDITNAPKDGRPILAFCVHEAAPCYANKEKAVLTTYTALAESGHCSDGWRIVAWSDSPPDIDDEPPLPAWWFALNRDGDIDDHAPAYPLFWVELPWAAQFAPTPGDPEQ
jgi:hypothetical protein